MLLALKAECGGDILEIKIDMLGCIGITIEAYILQTFHILQNFKSYHKTICSGRFCINLLLLPVLK